MTWTPKQRKQWLLTHDATKYYRDWSRKNKARNLLIDKAWRRRNPERMQAMYVRQRQRHGARYNANRKAWYEKNKARVCAENRVRHKEKRKFLNSLKNKPCADCRQRFPPCAMDFDHRRGKKRFGISRLLSASLKLLTREIAKCDLVCANCHRIRHHSDRLSRRHALANGRG